MRFADRNNLKLIIFLIIFSYSYSRCPVISIQNITTFIISNEKFGLEEDKRISNAGFARLIDKKKFAVAYSMINKKNNRLVRMIVLNDSFKPIQSYRDALSSFRRPINSKTGLHGILLRNRINNSISNVEFVHGMDPRVFVNGSYIFLLLNRYFHATKKTEMVLGTISQDLDGFFSNEIILNSSLLSVHGQKNWSPFVYGDEIYFVYSISPHLIVRYQSPIPVFSKSAVTNMSTVQILHRTTALNFAEYWEPRYGTLRGGTPSVRLNRTHFISAFHSSTNMKINENCLRNYFMVCAKIDNQ